MIALKPVLSAWLEEAEAAKRDPDRCGNGGFESPGPSVKCWVRVIRLKKGILLIHCRNFKIFVFNRSSI